MDFETIKVNVAWIYEAYERIGGAPDPAPTLDYSRWLITEVERLRRLEDILLANADVLENDPSPIGKLLRWIEFNPRPRDGETL